MVLPNTYKIGDDGDGDGGILEMKMLGRYRRRRDDDDESVRCYFCVVMKDLRTKEIWKRTKQTSRRCFYYDAWF